ncbi:MAG: sulfoxide reductase heme-binding subunit YedZ [Alteromonadaceae bacterium]|jgi:sulfoxide reductase heme-binding subunit YedZ|tara:strand:+ start:2437 stop:3051 length:615 start_codon:yes stop_codon:yes gene_type:complete
MALSFKPTVKDKVLLLKIIIHLSVVLPLINLYVAAFNDQLGADPVDAVIHFTGIGALNLLLITLTVSPIAKRFKLSYLLQTRRLLGLYAFSYAICHLINFLAFEVQFDMGLFFAEIFERPYITVGLVAFIFLVALGVTSINSIKRKMGKNWQKLHNFNYLVVLLVVTHFYWSVKSDITEPLIYWILTLLLLRFRFDKLKKWFSR